MIVCRITMPAVTATNTPWLEAGNPSNWATYGAPPKSTAATVANNATR